MNFWEFASVQPFWASAIVWVTVWIVSSTAETIWVRFMRTLNIRKHGWPPVHCDGDGDPTADSTAEN